MADKSINYVYGGPAFPIVYRDESKPGVISQEIHVGMQLRDYFAAQALNGFLSGFKHPRVELDISPPSWDWIAKAMFDMADAMLKARARETP